MLIEGDPSLERKALAKCLKRIVGKE